MPIKNLLVGSALILLTGCHHSLVRDTLPTITRTGQVMDVVIQDTVSPSSIMARPGDEIRWINKRQTDVQVIVISPGLEPLTCQRNFRQSRGADLNEYTANVERNDTAGVCFREPNELKYVVRRESSDPSGEAGFLGTVKIASEEHLWTPVQTPQTASLTGETR
jgi:plastocyanin